MGKISVKILDVLGKEIKLFSAEKISQSFQTSISLAQLSKETHYLQIQVANQTRLHKFVKL